MTICYPKTFRAELDFDLREEPSKTLKREKIHANNCAVRTEFFQQNPFPDLPAFKNNAASGFVTWPRKVIVIPELPTR